MRVVDEVGAVMMGGAEEGGESPGGKGRLGRAPWRGRNRRRGGMEDTTHEGKKKKN